MKCNMGPGEPDAGCPINQHWSLFEKKLLVLDFDINSFPAEGFFADVIHAAKGEPQIYLILLGLLEDLDGYSCLVQVIQVQKDVRSVAVECNKSIFPIFIKELQRPGNLFLAAWKNDGLFRNVGLLGCLAVHFLQQIVFIISGMLLRLRVGGVRELHLVGLRFRCVRVRGAAVLVSVACVARLIQYQRLGKGFHVWILAEVEEHFGIRVFVKARKGHLVVLVGHAAVVVLIEQG